MTKIPSNNDLRRNMTAPVCGEKCVAWYVRSWMSVKTGNWGLHKSRSALIRPKFVGWAKRHIGKQCVASGHSTKGQHAECRKHEYRPTVPARRCPESHQQDRDRSSVGLHLGLGHLARPSLISFLIRTTAFRQSVWPTLRLRPPRLDPGCQRKSRDVVSTPVNRADKSSSLSTSTWITSS